MENGPRGPWLQWPDAPGIRRVGLAGHRAPRRAGRDRDRNGRGLDRRHGHRDRRRAGHELGRPGLGAPSGSGKTPGRRRLSTPAAIYEARSPGVVTIFAFFGDEQDDAAGASQGSGFVVSTDGLVLTNSHVVTTAGETAGVARSARTVYVQFADGDRVPGRDRRVRPVHRRRRAARRPGGAPPLGRAARRLERRRGRRAGRRDRQPLRQRELAHGGRRLGDEALDRLADLDLQRRRRDPDRRADQPRQLGRPALRRARPRDRDQRPDPHRNGPERGGRLRDPDQRRQALARAARRRAAPSTTPTWA